eukprot:GFYU01000260.1.p1 GENE.GFYU01000260.1~~GFYU01000260.1.p1  ORF type:complete len:184 (-),score=38.67 GFYU01000260.1:400-951(-)
MRAVVALPDPMMDEWENVQEWEDVQVHSHSDSPTQSDTVDSTMMYMKANSDPVLPRKHLQTYATNAESIVVVDMPRSNSVESKGTTSDLWESDEDVQTVGENIHTRSSTRSKTMKISPTSRTSATRPNFTVAITATATATATAPASLPTATPTVSTIKRIGSCGSLAGRRTATAAPVSMFAMC